MNDKNINYEKYANNDDKIENNLNLEEYEKKVN